MQNVPEYTVEPLVTLKAAAVAFGVPEFKMRRAAKSGVFKTYHVGNTRTLVRLSEVAAAIDRSSVEGGQ